MEICTHSNPCFLDDRVGQEAGCQHYLNQHYQKRLEERQEYHRPRLGLSSRERQIGRLGYRCRTATRCLIVRKLGRNDGKGIRKLEIGAQEIISVIFLEVLIEGLSI
jgi:hypothetical protein